MPTKTGALRGPRVTTVDNYVKYLRRYGIVEVEDPYKEGFYTIKLHPDQNGYGFPDLYWLPYEGKNKNPKAVRSTRQRYGWYLQWYPKGIGWEYGRHSFMYGYGTVEEMKNAQKRTAELCRMLFGMIITGVRLNTLHCGNQVNANTAKELISQKQLEEVNLYVKVP